MAQAVRSNSTLAPVAGVPLSAFFTDPALKRFFERGERDNGAAFAVPAPKPLPIVGGAVRELEHA